MNSLYLSCLKTYWAEIWNVSWLPPNILLGPILVLLRPSLIIFFQYVSMCNVIFNSWAGPQSRSCHLFILKSNVLWINVLDIYFRWSLFLSRRFICNSWSYFLYYIYFFTELNIIFIPEFFTIQVAWPALGAAQELKITLHIETYWKNIIKDGRNSTEIGSSNIFGDNQLRFQISAQ